MTQLNIKQRCHVKKDTEIRLYLQERKKGMTQRIAAARAGIGERTARTYERAGVLPSQRKRLHDWKTRDDPFEEDWPWVVSQLERDPARAAINPLCSAVRTTSGSLSTHASADRYLAIFNSGAFCTDPIVR